MSPSDIDALAIAVRGAVLRPGDIGYDDARSLWNAFIDKRPALIVRVAGVADVLTSVKFARKHGLVIAVRGGGHNIAGTAVCEGGLVIDLSRMRAVLVDPADRVAYVEGGVTFADFDHETQAFGLATTGGVVSSTGVAGLTLGGGFGWLARRYGLAADNLTAVDLVTADGELIRASETDHRELFWGLRGGGGNFGVATRFAFRLHKVGPEILFGPTIYRLDDAVEVLKHYRQFAQSAPRECCVWADLLTAPPLPFLPERHHGTKVLTLMQCYVGDLHEGEAVLAPLRGFGEPIGDAVGPMRYTDAQQILDQTYEKGFRNYWKPANFKALSDQTIEKLVAFAATMPTPASDIVISQLGGAIGDVPVDATAFPHRDTAFVVTPGVRWDNSADDARCLAWVFEGAKALGAQASGGAYANFIAEDSGRERDAYGVNYERLTALKNRYDPTNLFRLNQNIRPTEGAS